MQSLRGLQELEDWAAEVLLYSSSLDASQEPPWKSCRQGWDGPFDLEWAQAAVKKGTA